MVHVTSVGTHSVMIFALGRCSADEGSGQVCSAAITPHCMRNRAIYSYHIVQSLYMPEKCIVLKLELLCDQ